MSKYKTSHKSRLSTPFPCPGTPMIKESTITDTESGKKATGYAWDSESYDKAYKQAWERLKKDK